MEQAGVLEKTHYSEWAAPVVAVPKQGGIDAYSKWPEVRLMSTTRVSKTCDVLREWFASQGILEQVVTVNGP